MELEWLTIFRDSIDTHRDGPLLLLTLATIDDELGVDARTVVCRDVGPAGTILFTSDSRSRKNKQLHANMSAVAVFWFAHHRRQFRVRGSVETVTSMDERSEIWIKLTDATKQSFYWPTPGSERTPSQAADSLDLSAAPATFSVLKLSPTEVDLLELSHTPHRRRLWQAARGWRVEELNP